MRTIKFRLWHKETKKFLNIFPYRFLDGNYTNGMPCKYVNNDFELTKDGTECNRLTGKSVFLTIDGIVIGLIPINENTTKSLDYSEEYELTQFTGLTDKNGKEIYEGDIVITANKSIAEICFGEYNYFFETEESDYTDRATGFYFYHPNKDTYESFASCAGGGGSQYEVIGNIYESPEKLKP